MLPATDIYQATWQNSNLRFNLEDMIPRLGYDAVRTPPMPQRLLSMAEAWG